MLSFPGLFALSLLALLVDTAANSGGLMLVDTNAAVKFGPNGDVNLYRSASNTLSTNNNLVVSGNVVCSGNVTAGPANTNLLQALNQQNAQIVQQNAQIVSLQLALNATTVYVGAGQQFATIQAALNWTATKSLLPLLIQVIDGTYTISSTIQIPALPTPHLLTLQGNVNNPGKCKLVAPPSCILSGIFNANFDSAGLTIQGFNLTGSSVCVANYIGGIIVNAGGSLFVNDVQITGYYYGVFVDQASSLYAVSLVVTSGYIGVLSGVGSYVRLTLSAFSGCTVAVNVDGVVHVNSALAISNGQIGVACPGPYYSLLWGFNAITFSSVTTHNSNCLNGNLEG